MRNLGLRIPALLILPALLLAGCGRGAKQQNVDPHSTENVLNHLIQHVELLGEAAQRQDFKYVHDFGYYVKSLAQALYSSLDEPQKAQSQTHLVELIEVINQLDAASGRRQTEATLAGTRRLREILNTVEAQLRPEKERRGNPAPVKALKPK